MNLVIKLGYLSKQHNLQHQQRFNSIHKKSIFYSDYSRTSFIKFILDQLYYFLASLANSEMKLQIISRMLKQLWKIINGEQKSYPQVKLPKDLFKMIECQANDPSQDRISSGVIEQIDAHYLAVFDGHGGSKVSEYLQNNIHNTIIKVIQNRSRVVSDNETLIKISLQQIFYVIQQNVLQIMNREALEKSNGFQECGSCALLAIVTKTHIYVANAGDSQGIIINSNPQKNRVTNRQLNTKSPLERQRLKKKFPKDDNLFVYQNNTYYIKGKIMPTHSIGDFSLKYKKPNKSMLQLLQTPYISYQPDTTSYSINPDDKFILLASDGLWDFLSLEEVSQIVLGNSKDDCLKVLIDRCYWKCAAQLGISKQQIMNVKQKRKYIDDISIVLFDLSNNC